MTLRAVLLYSSKGALKATEVLLHHVWPLVKAVLLTLMFTLNFLPDSVYRLEVIHSFTNFVEAQSNMCWWEVILGLCHHIPSWNIPGLLCQETLCLQMDGV